MSGVLIRIPTPLRRVTNGQAKAEIDASTMGELIDRFDVQFPGVKERLLDEAGELRYFVNVYLNGEDVRYLKGLDTAIKNGDEVSIVPAVAGGA